MKVAVRLSLLYLNGERAQFERRRRWIQDGEEEQRRQNDCGQEACREVPGWSRFCQEAQSRPEDHEVVRAGRNEVRDVRRPFRDGLFF
jgi:hypothetical protein